MVGTLTTVLCHCFGEHLFPVVITKTHAKRVQAQRHDDRDEQSLSGTSAFAAIYVTGMEHKELILGYF